MYSQCLQLASKYEQVLEDKECDKTTILYLKQKGIFISVPQNNLGEGPGRKAPLS